MLCSPEVSYSEIINSWVSHMFFFMLAKMTSAFFFTAALLTQIIRNVMKKERDYSHAFYFTRQGSGNVTAVSYYVSDEMQ